ncbi:hypothetical protein BU17DRAFT_94603 [Hysterangium stoloniferum]|nr:hypothetical protein BU17DRAFT_94603 [Hysterangium stoloniferum]
MRHSTIGAHPSFMVELAFDLLDEVFLHSVVVENFRLVVDIIILDKDLCSDNKEQAVAEFPLNITTILMHNDNCSDEQAMEKAAEVHQQRSRQFV